MNEMDVGRARKPITQEEISLWRLISVSDLQRILGALAAGEAMAQPSASPR
jgi:hypothetical protein